LFELSIARTVTHSKLKEQQHYNMEGLLRTTDDGQEEIRTGLGWRKIVPKESQSAINQIPIIDLSDMYHEDINKRRVVAKAICNACINSGFFYASNHGLPDDEVATTFSDAKRFFLGLTIEEKMELDTAKHEHYWGYYPIRTDGNHPGGKSKFILPRLFSCQPTKAI
jgi:hypothetical protein